LPSRWSSGLLALFLVAAACRSAAPTRISRVPDPTSPPLTGAPLGAEAATAARLAVAAAEAGDATAANRDLEAVPSPHPVRSLAALEVRYLRGEKVARQARELAEAEVGYGSAWGFAAVAARDEGDAQGALKAARRAEELQPSGGWEQFGEDVENSLTGALVGDGAAMLGAGNAAGALQKAREALAVGPDSTAARALAVRALITLHDLRGAAEMVPGLPDTPEGLELKGKVAEALGQWDLALDFYTRLPASNPRRCELVSTARTQWRLANAPPYLTGALAAKPLRRRHLAAIIAFEAPALGSEKSGAVPVFEDVVQIPERLDVLLVARSGVMPGDPIARRYGPDRTVSAREFQSTLDRLARALHRQPPHWCDDGATDCVQMPDPLDGEAAAALVRQVAGEGGEPCTQR